MIKVDELSNSINDFSEVKRQSVDYLLTNPKIIELIDKYNLDRSFIEDNWNDFVIFDKDYHLNHDQYGNLIFNPRTKGLYKEIDIIDGNVILNILISEQGQDILKNQRILSNTPELNVREEFLFLRREDLYPDTSRGLVYNYFASCLANAESKGIFLQGRKSIGKSTMLGYLIGTLANKGYKCGFLNWPTFISENRSNFENLHLRLEVMKNLDYLVIDDLGNEYISDYVRDSILFPIINYRKQNKLKTFYTSKYTLKELETLYSSDKSPIYAERIINIIESESKIFNL